MRLAVYDILGREVAVIEDGKLSGGNHIAARDCRSKMGQALASGVYNYRFRAGKHIAHGKLMYLR